MTKILCGKTILIVDDEDLMRRSIRTKLAKEGYECVEAASASEAIEQLRFNEVHLIILDIMMPGMSGLDLLPRLRHDYPNIGVIMSTAIVDPQTIVKCMKLGAHDYLPKPFEFEELLVSVGNAVVKSRLETELKNILDDAVSADDDGSGRVRELTLESFETMVTTLDSRDRYTAGHSRRVALMSGCVGLEMNLKQAYLDDLHWGALLHDIGKIAIDPDIENKPDMLNRQEYRDVAFHSQIGPAIVECVANQNIQDIIRHHHDHYNGRSLEQKKTGEQIPLGARIVAVADAYDSMTNDRPHRGALPHEKAHEEIGKYSGTQFDPRVVAAFVTACQDPVFHNRIMR